MDTIKTHVDGQIYFITLNRPEKRNALTIDMMEQIAQAAQAVDAMPQVRAIILHAEGPIFSAGIDLMTMVHSRAEAGDQHPARWLRRTATRLQDALNALEATEVPVIAAMQGAVLGMGLELALAADLRVAAQGCRLSIPEVRLGLVADVGGTTRLTRLIGPGRAKDMLLTARTVSADEALQWGLVNRVAAKADLLSTAVALAEEIAQHAPLAVGLTKLIVDQGLGADRATHMAIERWAQSQLIGSDDVAEAMSAFLEKRPPEFKGR